MELDYIKERNNHISFWNYIKSLNNKFIRAEYREKHGKVVVVSRFCLDEYERIRKEFYDNLK